MPSGDAEPRRWVAMSTYAQGVVIRASATTPAGIVILPSVSRYNANDGYRQEKRSSFQQLISMPACRNAGTPACRHVVFTLPEALNKLCLYKPAKVYKLLFDTAWSVMKSFAHDKKHLGAETGMIAILHTWGQNLSLHPHLHCIVPGGGLTKAGNWIPARSDGEFLFPVKAMSPGFRARFVAALRRTIKGLDRSFYDNLFNTSWVVYAKHAFGGPQQVIEYLGRYTHKIAISNHRLLDVAHNAVTFHYKDYRDASKKKIMTLDTMEFIQRFSLHILPKGFMRIRHYGILSSSRKQKTLPLIHEQLNSLYLAADSDSHRKKDWKQISTVLGFNPDCCPACKQQTMITLLSFDRRGPPDDVFIRSLKARLLQSHS